MCGNKSQMQVGFVFILNRVAEKLELIFERLLYLACALNSPDPNLV